MCLLVSVCVCVSVCSPDQRYCSLLHSKTAWHGHFKEIYCVVLLKNTSCRTYGHLLTMRVSSALPFSSYFSQWRLNSSV